MSVCALFYHYHKNSIFIDFRKNGGARASPNQLSFYYLFDIKRLVFQALWDQRCLTRAPFVAKGCTIKYWDQTSRQAKMVCLIVLEQRGRLRTSTEQ